MILEMTVDDQWGRDLNSKDDLNDQDPHKMESRLALAPNSDSASHGKRKAD